MSERQKPEPTTQPKEQSTQPAYNPDWSWSDSSSWPLSVKFSPVLVAIFGAVLIAYFPNLVGDVKQLSLFTGDPCVANFNYTFQIAKAKPHSEQLATHDWEIGTAGEALLELISPEKAVFSKNPFPGGKVPWSFFKMDEALMYVHNSVRLFDDIPTLYYNNFSAADPATLGVSAVMIGQHWPGWYDKAGTQMNFLLNDAPRYENGAISHRVDVAELWSDAVFMFPPFLAYYAVATKDLELMREAVRQCELYRDVLLIKDGSRTGLWKHIVGPSEKADDGAWSTGNAWAAYGMARVRATVAGWETSKEVMQNEVLALDGYIMEILEGAINTDNDESGLLRNYLGSRDWFGETSGTALMTAAAYRMAKFMGPGPERVKILRWADQKRRIVAEAVDEDGIAKPAVNPLKHDQREPLEGLSPEGESFLLLMGAAWRDCICAKVCSGDA